MIGYDLVMESPFAIPGALPLGDHGLSEPDLRIRWLSEQPPPASPEPIYRRKGDALIFSPPGLARFECWPNAIDIAPHRDADHELIVALLIATALPAAMWMRGGLVLHAAGVVLPGSDCALALVGLSGVGKSTLAAQLVERGASLIADDSVLIRRRAGQPMASGLPGGYHLADPPNAGRSFVSCPPGRQMGSASLGAVIVLSQADTDGALAAVGPIGAIELLLANQHRPRVPAALGRRADALRDCAFIANTTPVYTWRRKRGANALDRQDWATLTGCAKIGDRT